MSMIFIIIIIGLIFVVGGMVAVFLLNRSWGSPLDRSSELSTQPIATGPRAANGAVADEARALLARGTKIEAIKRVRELTGMGLKEAKEYVEALEANLPADSPALAPFPVAADAAQVAAVARQWLGQGNKIEAIKRVRELTGMGLKEAKDYVESL